MTQHSFFATVPRNLEALLAEELRGLGAEDVREARSGASFSGSLETAYRVCLWSRVANAVLLVLARFPASTPEALYVGVRAVDWSRHLTPTGTLAVDFNTRASSISHSHFGALKVKDAVVDQFREHQGARPSVDTQRPQVRINLHLLRDMATLSLDLSGDSLHRRGYRLQGTPAPLKENLAAAILLRAGWPRIAADGGALVDPMCGSGTFPIEAALMAADIAPGLRREYWGFQGWKGHDPGIWTRLLEEAGQRAESGSGRLPPIRGYDRDAEAVRIALANVARAGLSGRVHIERRELADCAPAARDLPGLVVANPPYGERLGEASELPALYTRLGETLMGRFSGWQAAVLTGNPGLGKTMGIRAKRMHTLFNGPIECRLLHFELTESSRVVERRYPKPAPREDWSEAAGMLANRLRKNHKALGRWLRQEAIHCYRLYDADLPEYALAIDVYEGDRRRVHVQEYEAPGQVDAHKAKRRLREALGVVLEVLEVGEEALYFKVRRRQKGAAQYEKQAAQGDFFEVVEGGNRFLVNLEDYLDTGLFLDHRLTRRLIGELAAGRDFLNLFAYTGTATVYAARGGAASTTTVDMSKTYLDWARRNLALNGLGGPAHRFIQADCLQWMRQAAAEGAGYGLVFLDPPSFSASKRMQGTLDIQRDHVDLIRAAADLLTADGVLVFTNNLRRFRMDADALPGLAIEDISRALLPRDFARNPRIHNCWRITRA